MVSDVLGMSIGSLERFPLETWAFQLHSMVRDAAYLGRCLYNSSELGFAVDQVILTNSLLCSNWE
jgi:hypothetical protein